MGASIFFSAASELATLTNEFDVNGVPTDPTTVSLTVTSPAGGATTYTYGEGTITKASTGVYTKDVDVSSENGQWQYDWTGTGTAQDHQTGTWMVWPADPATLYFTPADLKSRIGLSDALDDFELFAACYSASRHVENVCQRQFWKTASAVARAFPTWNDYFNLELPAFCDLLSVTTLKTDADGDGVFEVTWATTDYQLRPVNTYASPEQRPYTSVRAVANNRFPLRVPDYYKRPETVEITGIWGWPQVPFPVRQATAILAAEQFKLKDAPFGVAGFGDLGIVRIKDNPVVDRLLAPYKRQPFLVG